MNKIKFFIKDFWEDFHNMSEGSSPKYFINKCIWGIWFALFVASLATAAFLGYVIFKTQITWYKLRSKDYIKDVLRKRHGL
jgi:hypothetical protein